METIKAYTNLSQSKTLSKILPFKSADMFYIAGRGEPIFIGNKMVAYGEDDYDCLGGPDVLCWSLAALLNILHSKAKDIPSLSGGGYKDRKYISDWCLDYEFENGDYQKTFADNPIDACYEMILKLNELNLL